MSKKIYLNVLILVLGILALSKTSTAQSITFEVNIPGIKIVAGEPYEVVIVHPRIIYFEPLPEGYYYYDRCHRAYYDDYGNVYYYPSNVHAYRHDNGKHKGWYKKRHKHGREYDDD
jgi:hypothetical protein